MHLPNVDIFENILMQSRINDLLPFFKCIEKKELPELKKRFKTVYKHLTESYQVSVVSWGIRANATQEAMLRLSGIVLLTPTEFDRMFGVWCITQEHSRHIRPTDIMVRSHLEDFFRLAKPKWVAEVFSKANFVDYAYIRRLYNKQLMDYIPVTFASSVIQLPNQYHPKNDSAEVFQQQYNLLKSEIFTNKDIYAEDLPLIFEHPTNVFDISFGIWNTSYWFRKVWLPIIQKLVEQNLWDRQETLQKCIDCLKKDWQPNLSGGFKDLFDLLSPTKEEIMSLQNDLFYLLPIQPSSTVTFAINSLKKISTEGSFDAATFIEMSTLVLHRKDCKGGVRTILTMFDKIAKTQTDLRPAICLATCNVLMIDDLATQEKAVKLMEKYGDVGNEDLKIQLQQYESAIKGDLKKHLSQFYTTELDEIDLAELLETPPQYETTEKPIFQKLHADNVLQIPQNWNDFLFHIGKVLSLNNLQQDIEIFLQAFEQLHPTFPKDYKKQLEPYQKQAQQGTGVISNQIFSEFFQHWLSSYRRQPFIYKQLHYYQATEHLALLVQRFAQVYDKLLRGSTAPVLSAVTHAPYWIEPKIFVEKLIWYQQNDQKPDHLDMCSAICRLAFEETEAALALGEQHLEGYYRDLVLYLFGDSALPFVPNTTIVEQVESKWALISNKIKAVFNQKTNQSTNINKNETLYTILAARTKHPKGVFETFKETPFALYANVVAPFPIIVDEVLFKIQAAPNVPTDALIYSIGSRNRMFIHSYMHERDFEVALSFTPHLTDNLFIKACNFYNNADINSPFAEPVLKSLMREDLPPQYIHHLFLGLICFNKRKENRALAAETLILLIQRQNIDNQQFGDIIARLFEQKYGTLSRPLETLAILKDISFLHNSALKIIYEAILKTVFQQTEKPKFVKKLLEDYLDVLIKSNGQPTETTLNGLTKWSEEASLKKIIAPILQKRLTPMVS